MNLLLIVFTWVKLYVEDSVLTPIAISDMSHSSFQIESMDAVIKVYIQISTEKTLDSVRH